MVLDDELFTNMTYEQFARVTNPKVLGTQLLDELFYNDISLECFVVASSISSVIGWSGQSNYSAANEFMAALINKRRKRGVVGSAMNIPAVLGVWYAAHSDTFDFDYFQSLGYINISEEDLHVLFAEAILSGRPGEGSASSDLSAQVAMGVNYIPTDLYVKEAHRRDIKFSHFTMREETASDGPAVKAGGVRVRVALQTAKDADDAYAIIRDTFVAHLKRMLRMTEDQTFQLSLALVEQGVDSLVAVDIRSWFLKELEVDVPTLKIMGGRSIDELVQVALEKRPNTQQQDSTACAKQAQVATARARVESPTPTSETALSIFAPGSPESLVMTPALVATPSVSESGSGRTSPPIEYFDKGGIKVEASEVTEEV